MVHCRTALSYHCIVRVLLTWVSGVRSSRFSGEASPAETSLGRRRDTIEQEVSIDVGTNSEVIEDTITFNLSTRVASFWQYQFTVESSRGTFLEISRDGPESETMVRIFDDTPNGTTLPKTILDMELRGSNATGKPFWVVPKAYGGCPAKCSRCSFPSQLMRMMRSRRKEQIEYTCMLEMKSCTNCGAATDLAHQVAQDLPGAVCHNIRLARTHGFIEARCKNKVLFEVSRGEQVNGTHAWKLREPSDENDDEKLDEKLRFRLVPPEAHKMNNRFGTQLQSYFWNGSCTLKRINWKKKRCKEPIGSASTHPLKSSDVGYQFWDVQLRCDAKACDPKAWTPMLILKMVALIGIHELDVPEFGAPIRAKGKKAPSEDTARCGDPFEEEIHIGTRAYPASRKPCTRAISSRAMRDGCKCNGATLRSSGKLLSWCYVDDCADCAKTTGPNVSRACYARKVKSWALCHGDGYAPNRPVDGFCPLVHECTGWPYRGLKQDMKVVNLEKTIGRTIEAESVHVYQPMLGSVRRFYNKHHVQYTRCLPLGQYSRWLWTDLYIPGKEGIKVRHDIEINEKTFGFSSDLFYTTSSIDVHLKFDLQFYSSFDANYIDSVLWIDVLQPFGDREYFPVEIPFFRMQRRFKTCLNQIDGNFVASALSYIQSFLTGFSVCVAYTEDYQLFLSFRMTLIGMSLPLSREVHVANVVVKEERGENVVSGFKAGNLSFVAENVTFSMRAMRERTTWDLTKMVVELKREGDALVDKEERMEAKLNLLEQWAVSQGFNSSKLEEL